jgi:hypothetical protein
MPFSARYLPFIDTEEAVAKTLVRPRNIYKIISYEYIDGKTKTLTGPKTSYVFVLGIFEKKLNCIKISEVRPERFFDWFKTIFRKSLTEEKLMEAERLEDLIILGDRQGNKLFNSYVKGKQIYNQNPCPYRTYNLDGIKQISEIKFKKEILKEHYK